LGGVKDKNRKFPVDKIPHRRYGQPGFRSIAALFPIIGSGILEGIRRYDGLAGSMKVGAVVISEEFG
jgi:hypothetical protein